MTRQEKARECRTEAGKKGRRRQTFIFCPENFTATISASRSFPSGSRRILNEAFFRRRLSAMDHMAIQGNVPPVDVLRFGTPQDVLRSSKECIRKAWDSPGGFTLTSGCQTPMDTPAENLQALMDAARIFGRYPMNAELLAMDDA